MKALGKVILVVGPGGVGKNTVVNHLVRTNEHFQFVPSYTTRPMRPHESEGDPYHFVTRTDFDRRISSGFFLEWQKVHDNLYGSPKDAITSALLGGQFVITDMEVLGASVLIDRYPADICSVFLAPPSMTELRRRLQARPASSPTEITERLARCDMETAVSGMCDYLVVNDDIQDVLERFETIRGAELAREALREYKTTEERLPTYHYIQIKCQAAATFHAQSSQGMVVVGSTKIGVSESPESATRRFFRLQHLRTGSALNVDGIQVSGLSAGRFPVSGLVRSCIKWEHDVVLAGDPSECELYSKMCVG
jgi:guanylate kinase